MDILTISGIYLGIMYVFYKFHQYRVKALVDLQLNLYNSATLTFSECFVHDIDSMKYDVNIKEYISYTNPLILSCHLHNMIHITTCGNKSMSEGFNRPLDFYIKLITDHLNSIEYPIQENEFDRDTLEKALLFYKVGK